MFRWLIGCACLMMCCALHAAQVSVTNEHVVTVVNVNGAGGTASVQDAAMLGRIAKLEAGLGELRASVDGRLKAIECRVVREDANEEKIAERLDKACASADEFYGKRYENLMTLHHQFMAHANIWIAVVGGIVGGASLIATVLSVVFGCVLPRKELAARNVQINAIHERMLRMEEKSMIDRTLRRAEERNQGHWILTLISQSVYVAKSKKPIDRQQLVHSLSCYIFQFYQLIEGCVRDDNGNALVEEIDHSEPFLTRWLVEDDPDLRNAFNSALIGVKKRVQPSRSEYEKLLCDKQEALGLLAKLFARIGVWEEGNA